MTYKHAVYIVEYEGYYRRYYCTNKEFDKYGTPHDFETVKTAELFLDRKFHNWNPSSNYEIISVYKWRKSE